jgi:hypothetical protein
MPYVFALKGRLNLDATVHRDFFKVVDIHGREPVKGTGNTPRGRLEILLVAVDPVLPLECLGILQPGFCPQAPQTLAPRSGNLLPCCRRRMTIVPNY